MGYTGDATPVEGRQMSDHNAPAGERSTYPYISGHQKSAREQFSALLAATPIPSKELPRNLPLYLSGETLGDVLSCAELYQRILCVPGDIMEFGARWGRRLGLFVALRELLEPHNYTRRVVGFDTFSGFPEVGEADGSHPLIRPGSFSVSDGYLPYLVKVLEAHEGEGPWSHIQRFEVVAGDVRRTVPSYLEHHPECLISLAYFDLDLYEPTRECLIAVLDRMTQGSVIVFDELAQVTFPGETCAVREVLSIADIRLMRFPYHPSAFFVK